MRIGVIGGGVVGSAIARSYLEHVESVYVYDAIKERRTCELNFVVGCDVIFICLPTPQKSDSLECDTSAIDNLFYQLTRFKPFCERNYVLKSTVPIGTTRKLRETYGLTNLVHSPEFLTARCAHVDAMMPTRNIIGFPGKIEGTPLKPYCLLNELYLDRWPHIPVLHMDSNESEAVKLFQNSFFAVKIAFWNEVRTLADKLDLDWGVIMNAILADGRIHPSHTQVPGPDGQYGFGGTCLPKDLSNLAHTMLTAGMRSDVSVSAYLRNATHDRKRT